MVRIKNIHKTIQSHIALHKDDTEFSEADYILNVSPLSPFLKLMKVTTEDIEPFIHSPQFCYTTYCIYVKLFLEPGAKIDNGYTALKHYQTSDYNHIGWYKKQIAVLKAQIQCSLNQGPKVKAYKDNSLDNIKSIVETGKTNGSFASPGEWAIAYIKRADYKLFELVKSQRETILNDFAAYGWLRDELSSLTITFNTKVELKSDSDVLENIFGFTMRDVHKRAMQLQNELFDTVYRLENFLLTKEHEEQMQSDIIYRSSAVNVPEEIIKLAKKLEQIHAQVSISNESSGFQIAIPDPELLETDGLKELSSRHLSINAELYLGIGRYDVDVHPTKENRERWVKYREKNKEVPCAMSMKTGKLFSVNKLLAMKPVEERGLDFGKIRHTCIDITNTSLNLIDDGTGTMVPEWCGKTIPLTDLPKDHPAIKYLEERGFDPVKLQEHLDVSYCIEAAPEDRSKGRFYSKLNNGMRNTPLGRIILPIWMDGHRMGYQCRIIDKKTDDDSYFVWDGSNYRVIKLAGNDLFPADERFPKGFNPHKYMNALGSKRNMLLMGYDQAVKWNKDKGFDKNSSFCILVEGPLDAAKIGPPAIAILGKSLSPMQADYIKAKFGKIIIVADNDKAGQECKRCIYERLSPYPVDDVTVEGGKDAGDLSYEDALKLVKTSEFYKS